VSVQETPAPLSPATARRRRRWYDSPLASKQATHGLYIEIVVLALILALEGKRVSDASVVSTVFGALFALVLAEFYAYYLGTMIGTGKRPTGSEIRAVLAGTAWSLAAAVPPVALLMLGVFGPLSQRTGFFAAKLAGAGVIAVYALVASRRAGLGYRRSILTGLVFLAIAVGLVLLKRQFH
jgi:hypothetical protein